MASLAAWSWEENKIFEDALVTYPDGIPNRWFVISRLLHGKSSQDVAEHYLALEQDIEAIESGAVELLKYIDDYEDSSGDMGNGNEILSAGPSGVKKDQRKKRGTPWTEDEHRHFLAGLEKFGQGAWREISRMFVKTKTSTQVASHAQKYNLRQKQRNSGSRDTKRKSIHDITSSLALAIN